MSLEESRRRIIVVELRCIFIMGRKVRYSKNVLRKTDADVPTRNRLVVQMTGET